MTWPAANTPAVDVIAALGLEPLAGEGGHWGPVYREEAGNAILFLLTAGADGFSALHRLTVTESWTWLAGAPASMLLLGSSEREVVLDAGHPGVLVRPGTWQGASTLGDWTLVACWCVPSFTDECFTLGVRAELLAAHPGRAALIDELTRP